MNDVPASVTPEMWQNAKGHLVPRNLVKPEQALEDELVRRLHARAAEARTILAALKRDSLSDIHAFVELLNQKYGAKRGGQRGNVTLSSFDGSLRLLLKVNDFISFGPELQSAKALLDELLLEWSAGANQNIRAIVLDAFAVDKAGKVAVDRILGLRRLDIEDERWQRAMQAIGDAVRVTASREYVHFQQRTGGDQYDTQPLDFARL